MQSIRQYQKIKAQVRDICLNTDLAYLEKSIDTDSSTSVDEEKLPSTSSSPSQVPGVQVRNVVGSNGQKEYVFIVGWDGDVDPVKPKNWSPTRRWVATTMLCLISMMGAAASSIDAAVEPQSTEAFYVKDEVGTLTTGMLTFLFHFVLSFGPSNDAQVAISSVSPLDRSWRARSLKPLVAISCTLYRELSL